MSAQTERPPQHWLVCVTCDVRYLNRSAESQRHQGPEHKVERQAS